MAPKIVYASKTGNVQTVVEQLGLLPEAVKIVDGTEHVDGDFVLFTYTVGKGQIPKPVRAFLESNPGVVAVVGSGSTAKSHIDTFNFAAKRVSETYGVPVIAKLDGVGTSEDLEVIRAGLAAL
ncbi:ribonucleotide reductase [Actinomyces sp. Z5]|uniref:class Ib ribonucleoside-diphosphate reductase assembly flavoprotein NrdI n=1 Tax=Actinomyces sp. Z5 TaxID=2250216 RepID=UPI000DCE5E49|nr:class Ib ribonucleoside-diphosphate reductase assembly flavoprotein NrdI [Actinomyces sp. Z5]RAX19016.1 ribonucleotide reductase [Actinomyces sp. Z5]